MKRATFFVTLVMAVSGASAAHAQSQHGFTWPVVQGPDAAQANNTKRNNAPSQTTPRTFTTGAIDPTPSPVALAVSQTVDATPSGPTDEDAADDAALKAFYSNRSDDPLWVSETGLNHNALSVIAEIKNGAAWGLDPKAITLPHSAPEKTPLTEAQQAALEVKLSRAALLYARHARGGRIMAPSKMLNSHLNRSPQLLPPEDMLNGLAAAQDPARYLTTLHPHHEQFQRLRLAYLSVRTRNQTKLRIKSTETLEKGQTDRRVAKLRKRLGIKKPINPQDANLFDAELEDAVRSFQKHAGLQQADGSIDFDTVTALNKRVKGSATKLQANMEMWRWMWDDLGDLHVLANIPEFMLSLKKNGETLYRERVVVGQVSKQSSVFTRTLKHIVLKPMWRVPESIKVRELWPSLKRGGGLMRQYGLKVETKDGKPVNWRKKDWYKEDIRNYEVVQPSGRYSVMGKVKFSFPSQHTIYIHDTQDKYMFRSKRRTFSHGCLRLRNPVKMAKLLLKEEKGWDADHVDDLIATGPHRNAIKMETRVPMHLTYFTAWVDDTGAVKTFSDIYGHEKRVRQALAGQWSRIAKGRNHLAPPQPIAGRGAGNTHAARARKRGTRPADYINRAITGSFF